MRRPRVSQSFRLGPLRIRGSVPLGRGQKWLSVGTRDGLGWIGASMPVGGPRGRRRRRG